MVTIASVAEIASLAGDPARASMLLELMDGRALTSGELARAANVAPQTASGHLAKLAKAGLVTIRAQGRHRYHRLASARIAEMLESLMKVAAESRGASALRTGPRDANLRAARTCYDHIAGRLGVALADLLVERGHVVLDDESAALTKSGAAFFARLGFNAPDETCSLAGLAWIGASAVPISPGAWGRHSAAIASIKAGCAGRATAARSASRHRARPRSTNCSAWCAEPSRAPGV